DMSVGRVLHNLRPRTRVVRGRWGCEAAAAGCGGCACPRRSERINGMGRLDELDLSLKLSRADEAQRLNDAQARLLQLRLLLGGLTGPGKIGPPVLVLFEGWDASGKGGA